MENAIVTLSNLYAIRAAYSAGATPGDQAFVMTAMFASIFYHAAERRKHNMPGLIGNGSVAEHNLLINLDRAAAVALIVWLLHKAARAHVMMGVAALILLALSEAPHVIPRLFPHAYPDEQFGYAWKIYRVWYVLFHTAWHVAAFHVAYCVINQ